MVRSIRPDTFAPMRRRRANETAPPPLGAIVVDGSNVIASGLTRAVERLDLALAWCRTFRPDLEVLVFLDRATVRRCPPAVQEVLQTRLAAGSFGAVRYELCAAGAPADASILRAAAARRALIVSNDRFFDLADLRSNQVTVQFLLARGAFTASDEATWFRTPGLARRVPVQDLQRAGASAS
jgi:hypothetical protein